MTNFATFIDTGNAKAPIAQRGKASRNAPALPRLGLGPAATRDGGIAALTHAYPGNGPMSPSSRRRSRPSAQYAALAAASGQQATDTTVVLDAGQNSEATFAHLADTELCYGGRSRPVPAATCSPARHRPVGRRPGALRRADRPDTRRPVYGAERRAILPLPPSWTQTRPAGFDGTTFAKAGLNLDQLAATLVGGKTRLPRTNPEPSRRDHRMPWVRRVVTCSWPASSPATCAWPGTSARPPAPPWKKSSSASTC